ncbi:MAG: hypothetical protein AAF405_09890 [Pseudomonadota bacterium]
MNDLLSVPKLSKRHQRWGSRYGPWAVVAGASDGIGRAIATGLAKSGMNDRAQPQ